MHFLDLPCNLHSKATWLRSLIFPLYHQSFCARPTEPELFFKIIHGREAHFDVENYFSTSDYKLHGVLSLHASPNWVVFALFIILAEWLQHLVDDKAVNVIGFSWRGHFNPVTFQMHLPSMIEYLSCLFEKFYRRRSYMTKHVNVISYCRFRTEDLSSQDKGDKRFCTTMWQALITDVSWFTNCIFVLASRRQQQQQHLFSLIDAGLPDFRYLIF